MTKSAKNVASAAKAHMEEPLKLVAAIRERIAGLKARRDVITAAPVPFEIAAVALDAQIAALAKEYDGGYRVGALLRVDRDRAPSIDLVPSRDDQVGKWVMQMMLAYFIGDTIGSKLKSELRKKYGDLEKSGNVPMATAEREAALKAIDDQIRAAELEEEALIVEAEQVGIAIARRGDLSPLVFLEIEV